MPPSIREREIIEATAEPEQPVLPDLHEREMLADLDNTTEAEPPKQAPRIEVVPVVEAPAPAPHQTFESLRMRELILPEPMVDTAIVPDRPATKTKVAPTPVPVAVVAAPKPPAIVELPVLQTADILPNPEDTADDGIAPLEDVAQMPETVSLEPTETLDQAIAEILELAHPASPEAVWSSPAFAEADVPAIEPAPLPEWIRDIFAPEQPAQQELNPPTATEVVVSFVAALRGETPATEVAQDMSEPLHQNSPAPFAGLLVESTEPAPPVCATVAERLVAMDQDEQVAVAPLLVRIAAVAQEYQALVLDAPEPAALQTVQAQLEEQCTALFEALGLRAEPEAIAQFIQFVLRVPIALPNTVPHKALAEGIGTHEVKRRLVRLARSLLAIIRAHSRHHALGGFTLLSLRRSHDIVGALIQRSVPFGEASLAAA